MASLSKIIDVHSHPILPFGEGAPVVMNEQATSFWMSSERNDTLV